MIFTRHLITCGLVIETEHVSETEQLSFIYPDGAITIEAEPYSLVKGVPSTHPFRRITIGGEPYSLVICPHSDLPENPWRIEGLRRKAEDDDTEEIWYIGTIEACIAEFERITEVIRDNGHQIIEPDDYDFEKAVREFHSRESMPPWNLQE